MITKRLTKAPKDYPDPRKLPHVMVAMEMLKLGMSVSTGIYTAAGSKEAWRAAPTTSRRSRRR